MPEIDREFKYTLILKAYGNDDVRGKMDLFVSRILTTSLGDYQLFTEDGTELVFDRLADDGHHAGHTKVIETRPAAQGVRPPDPQ